MKDKVRDGIPWVLVAVIALALLGSRYGWFGLGRHGSPGPASSHRPSPSSGPATSVALPGGGRSDGDKCGATGFHHFTLPTASRGRGNDSTPPPGPQLTLGSFGFTGASGQDPARIDVQLLFGAGGRQPLLLSPPLGPRGVAVEIEGPDGLVGGAYDLPVVLGPGTTHGSDGKIHIDPEVGGSATVVLPLRALCPGYDGLAVVKKLDPPIDAQHTVTGPPPYTLTVSISDPAAGRIRGSIGSPVTGDVMSADNADFGDPADAWGRSGGAAPAPPLLRHDERMITHHERPEGSAPVNGYSHAVAFTGTVVVVSGQVPLDADGTLVGEGDAEAQTRQVFENLTTVLAASGARWADVVKITVFLTDIAADLPAFRRVRDAYVDPSRLPASSLVQVAGLVHPAFRVEIEAMAVVGGAQG